MAKLTDKNNMRAKKLRHTDGYAFFRVVDYKVLVRIL